MAKRILIVSPTPTHPPISGSRSRINAMISCLKQMGHDVHFLHIERELGDRVDMQKTWGNGFHSVSYKRPPKTFTRRLLKKLESFIDNESRYRYALDEWWDNAANNVLLRLQAQYEFEVVIVEYVFFSKALTLFPTEVLKIIDTHDVFSDRYKLFLKNNLQPVWYSTTKKEERKGLERADRVIAIQDSENEFFSRLSRTPVITVGHVVPLVPLSEQANDSIRHKILYVASNNSPNLEAIEWFIQNVLGEIRAKVSNAELLVAGKICDSLREVEGMTKIGIVDDLCEAYDSAAVVINPMFRGTGLKIKNVEALGYSKALITSPVGAEGMEDAAGVAFLVAEGAEEFIASIVQILTDDKLLKNLSQHAHAYVAKLNDNIMNKLEEAVNP